MDGVPYIDFLPETSAADLAELPAMAARCRGCAYTPGTEANLHPITSRLARECAEARCAFFCHLTADVQSPDATATHLCAGWLEAIRADVGSDQLTKGDA
ncbi:MAG TPA: hypothetical protein VJP88_08690 [Caulobacteraceae bacterium]|nr:hypothetical protein [Caulobacteraceae bacterium]